MNINQFYSLKYNLTDAFSLKVDPSRWNVLSLKSIISILNAPSDEVQALHLNYVLVVNI